MTERPSYVVAGLIAKRRELAGVIAELQRQLDQHRADLSHIDGVLRILASNLDPNTIKPKRPYRRTLYFERHETLATDPCGTENHHRAVDRR
jgi:hypothetical protein